MTETAKATATVVEAAKRLGIGRNQAYEAVRRGEEGKTTMRETKSRGGRPGRKIEPGERAALGLRVTPELKTRLDRAAKESGRSQSQEAELRLERSFEREGLLAETLELRYGPQLAGVLLMLGEAMKDAGEFAGFQATYTLEGSRNWFEVPAAFDQAAQAAGHVIEALRPPGEADVPDNFLHGIGHANGVPVAALDRLLGIEPSQWRVRTRSSRGREDEHDMTKGPWTLEPQGPRLHVNSKHGTVCQLAELGWRPDAALIAAAPDLYEALNALDRMSRGVDWCDPDEQARRWANARAALARATGQDRVSS